MSLIHLVSALTHVLVAYRNVLKKNYEQTIYWPEQLLQWANQEELDTIIDEIRTLGSERADLALFLKQEILYLKRCFNLEKPLGFDEANLLQENLVDFITTLRLLCSTPCDPAKPLAVQKLPGINDASIKGLLVCSWMGSYSLCRSGTIIEKNFFNALQSLTEAQSDGTAEKCTLTLSSTREEIERYTKLIVENHQKSLEQKEKLNTLLRLEQANQTYENEIRKLQLECTTQQETNKSLGATNATLEKKNADLEEEIDALTKENESTRENNLRLIGENNQLIRQNCALQEQHKQTEGLREKIPTPEKPKLTTKSNPSEIDNSDTTTDYDPWSWVFFKQNFANIPLSNAFYNKKANFK